MKELDVDSIMTKSISYQNSDLNLHKETISTIPKSKEFKEHAKEIVKIRKLTKSKIDSGLKNYDKNASIKVKSKSISVPKVTSKIIPKEEVKVERGWEVNDIDIHGIQLHNHEEVYQLPLINSRKIVPTKGINKRYRFSNIK